MLGILLMDVSRWRWFQTYCYGQNAAPPRMMIIPLFIGFQPSQVVQDFIHQQYQGAMEMTLKVFFWLSNYGTFLGSSTLWLVRKHKLGGGLFSSLGRWSNLTEHFSNLLKTPTRFGETTLKQQFFDVKVWGTIIPTAPLPFCKWMVIRFQVFAVWRLGSKNAPVEDRIR